MTEFTLDDVPAAIVATVRRTVPITDLPDFFGTAFDEVAGAVAEAGGRVAGAPFAWYHGMPTQVVDVSAGFEVVGGLRPAAGGVALGERPGGRAAVALHVGPYDRIAQTWSRLLGWLSEQGLRPGPVMWEEYLSPPEGDPTTWRTRLVALLG